MFALGAFAPGAFSQSLEMKCLARAAEHFRLPLNLLRAIREQEAGKPGFVGTNKNGSFDYGVMQINSIWLPTIEPLGYSSYVLTHSVCDSVMAGAWILASQMQRLGVWNKPDADPEIYWKAIGAYHSKTPHLNRRYAELVWSHYLRLNQLDKQENAESKSTLVDASP